MKAVISIKPSKLREIKKRSGKSPRVMMLGNHVISQEPQEFDIPEKDEHLLDSVQAQVWMDVKRLDEPAKPKAQDPAPVVEPVVEDEDWAEDEVED